MSCAETAEPIDLLFGLWTRVGRRKHKFNCQVAPMCHPMWAHWCHLAKMTEPSVCGGDAVSHQITLTTCFDTVGLREGHPTCKKMGGWWRWALASPDGVTPIRMVGVSASVNLPLHHKVQKFSSGTGSTGWSLKKGCKMVVVWYAVFFSQVFYFSFSFCLVD